MAQKIKLSIRYKVLGLILLTLTLVIGTIAFVVITQQSQTLTELVFQNANKQVKDIRFYAARSILLRDEVGVVDTLKRANDMEGFVAAAVFRADTKKQISRYYKEDKFPKKEIAEQNGIYTKLAQEHWAIVKKDKRGANPHQLSMPFPSKQGLKLYVMHAAIYHPFVKKKPPLLGMVQLSFSNEVIERALAANRRNILIGAAGFLTLGILVSLFLANYIVKPIRILSDGAEKVGGGDLEYKVPPLGNDELGMLASQFNAMTDGLKQAQKAKEEQLVIDEQIRQATEIQEGMNPAMFLDREEFQVKGFTRAAKGVGGDYFDFQVLEDGRLAVLISDVSGKSISASLVMVLIKTVVSTYLKLFNKVRGDRIVTTINQVMCSQAHIDKFATFFFCVYDPVTRKLDFTNGGHGPVFIYRAKDRVCTLSKLEGLPMGIDEDNEYKLARLELNPGDIIVLYTDGINEAWNENKDEFGVSRLRQQVLDYADLNAKEMVDKIIADIDEFTGGAEQHDDMSIVVMKVPA